MKSYENDILKPIISERENIGKNYIIILNIIYHDYGIIVFFENIQATPGSQRKSIKIFNSELNKYIYEQTI